MENNFDIHEWQAKHLTKLIKEEQDSTDREMFDLQQQFLPQFEEFVRLYGIVLGADIEEENPDDAPYIIHRKEFLADLKVVLFKLQHGEY